MADQALGKQLDSYKNEYSKIIEIAELKNITIFLNLTFDILI